MVLSYILTNNILYWRHVVRDQKLHKLAPMVLDPDGCRFNTSSSVFIHFKMATTGLVGPAPWHMWVRDNSMKQRRIVHCVHTQRSLHWNDSQNTREFSGYSKWVIIQTEGVVLQRWYVGDVPRRWNEGDVPAVATVNTPLVSLSEIKPVLVPANTHPIQVQVA